MSNLGFTAIPENAEAPEAAANDALNRIDAALTETLTKDASSANVEVTLTEAQTCIVLLVTGAAVARDVALPQCKRLLFVRNTGSGVITLKRGTASIDVAATGTAIVRLNGSANGLFDLTPSGSGGAGLPSTGRAIGKVLKIGSDGTTPEWGTDAVGSGGGGGGGGTGLLSFTGEAVTPIPPVYGDLSQTDQGGTTFKDLGDAGVTMVQKGLHSGSGLFSKMWMAPPSGDWTLNIGVQGNIFGPSFPSFGAFAEASDGKMFAAEIVNVSGVIKLEFNRWASDTTYSSGIASIVNTNYANIAYFKFAKTSSGLSISLSPDGVDFYQLVTNDTYLGSFAKTGFFIKTDSSSSIFVKANCFHFDLA